MIQIGDSRIWFSIKHEFWEFSYKNMSFCSFALSFVWPGHEKLDSIIKEFQLLEPEMKSRIRSGSAIGGGLPIDDGETVLIKVDDLALRGTYELGWSGGDSWGDMGIDFVVKDGQIVDEFWGD